MNILFVMERRVNAGSIQALANYMRVSKEFGYAIALYGPPDPRFREIECSIDAAAFDYVIFIFESKLNWPSGLQLAHLLTTVPRSRRVILDADGMFNPIVSLDGYDRNHASEGDRQHWLAAYAALADRIVQPSLWPCDPRVQPLLFYGYDPAACTRQANGKRVDIMHVAHNWWRWRDVSERLLPAMERVRGDLGKISFVGLWWDQPPAWAADIGQQEAFCVDPGRFRDLQIEVRPAVPYREVIATMSTARVNIMTQRPLFRRLGLVTSKYFELFAADTIPLVLLEPAHAELIYGPAGREVALSDDIGGKLIDALEHPKKYRDVVHAIRQHLTAHHSYKRRLQELIVTLDHVDGQAASAK